ncbi:uracil-DNA glycosylase, family 4 [Holospora obtusa F1]|uniref:Type-4 uracil-DNA glycosylase n=1 Tax=Holospora obtusa F1 TaxID=1399147 RepID=W6TDC5_HOLOB|nr:uracil-DNA glycosylase [Holospora obtusa]ETZ07003.1 uracil-DNA glycosylase, family 4 [Holospora obtusa F1]
MGFSNTLEERAAALLLWYRLQGVRTACCFRSKCSVEKGVSHDSFMFKNAKDSSSLEKKLSELYQEIKEFEGCALSKSCLNIVFSDGNPRASIMIVGEAPGAEEDRLSKPFVGLSGQLLDKMLAVFGWDRTVCYIINIVPWRPPFNRQPSLAEVEICLPFVDRHIQIICPKILLCVGAVACKALLRKQKNISILQNSDLSYVSPIDFRSIPVFAFYHPAYLLRSPGQKRIVWRHMLRMKAFLMKNPEYCELFTGIV